jgi:hypothetical protein
VQSISQCLGARRERGRSAGQENPDARQFPRLLRARRERVHPRAAEKGDELASPHPIQDHLLPASRRTIRWFHNRMSGPTGHLGAPGRSIGKSAASSMPAALRQVLKES